MRSKIRTTGLSLSLGLASIAGIGLNADSAARADDWQGPSNRAHQFDISELTRGAYGHIPNAVSSAAAKRDQGLRVIDVAGAPFLADTSLTPLGIATATSADVVQVSWVPRRSALGYTVTRDGVLVANLPADSAYFRDRSVRPGSSYRYTVSPANLTKATKNHPVWSVLVTVPRMLPGESPPKALQRQAAIQTAAAAASPTTTLTWVTFIPQARVSAPPKGCEYGSSYEFGGDNRGYNWQSSSYRTALNAVITWSSKSVAGHTAVGETRVYRKSTGALAARRTVGKTGLEVRKLGVTGSYVDIRMSQKVGNPFCSFGAIDGAATIQLTQSGNWAIRSGEHRQMPNHHIFIYNAGRATDIYVRNYGSLACLISFGCARARMVGFIGEYS